MLRKKLPQLLLSGLLAFSATSFAEKAKAVEGVVDINHADLKTLTTIKGLGEKRAEAIIAYRQSHGEFKTVDALSQVKGLGKKFVDKNKNHLSLK